MNNEELELAALEAELAALEAAEVAPQPEPETEPKPKKKRAAKPKPTPKPEPAPAPVQAPARIAKKRVPRRSVGPDTSLPARIRYRG